jgi:hypothetical protein
MVSFLEELEWDKELRPPLRLDSRVETNMVEVEHMTRMETPLVRVRMECGEGLQLRRPVTISL